jgi:hypothetical protein
MPIGNPKANRISVGNSNVLTGAGNSVFLRGDAITR